MKFKKSFLLIVTIVLSVFISGCFDPIQKEMKISLISDAVNPNYKSIPSQITDNYDDDFVEIMQTFSVNSAKAIIKNDSKNILLSPISYYMTLAILAEMTNGITNEQILTSLKMSSLDYIRSNTKLLFEKSYKLKGDSDKMFLGNSLWIDDSFTVKEDLLKDLAQYYYALSYNGDLQSLETAKRIKEFIESSTGNLIKNPVESYLGDPLEVLQIFNTLYLESKWVDKLIKAGNMNFTLPDGSIVSSDFLYGDEPSMAYVTKNYTSYIRNFRNGFKMNFILPSVGKSPYDLIEEEAVFKEIIKLQDYMFNTEITVGRASAYLPQFSYRSNIDLINPTKGIGITDMFNPSNTGFKKVNSNANLYVSGYKQETYIELDENGIKAAAITKASVSNESDEIVDMILNFDRPFLYIIYDKDNIPLFIGLLNNPNE